MSTAAQTHQQDLERLKALRYIDDDFMTVCLADNHIMNAVPAFISKFL